MGVGATRTVLSPTEIGSLRNELLRCTDQVYQIVTFSVTGATALMGFGLNARAPVAGLIVLVPLLILATSMSLVANRRLGIMRIATYLRAFGGDEFQFETRLWELRQMRRPSWGPTHLAMIWLLFFVGCVCVVLSVLLLKRSGVLVLVPSLVAAAWLAFGAAQYRQARASRMGGGRDEATYEAWCSTRNDPTARRYLE